MGFDHFIGNYGGSRWSQNEDFERFHGPIIIGTNCPIPPKGSYLGRLFTTGPVSYPGIQTIPGRQDDMPKNFSEVIEMAKICDPPEGVESGSVHIGCAHEALLCNSTSVLKAVLLGDISRFFLFAGCGGRPADRDYYTELARKLPSDALILTAGCAKYRFNKLDLGEVAGIPRLLDAGQCNDSYSLILMVQELVVLMGAESINELPISFDIALYEQKAVSILFALLHLGVEGIRLGPSLPSYISPSVGKLLTRRFSIRPVITVDEDLAAMMGGQ